MAEFEIRYTTRIDLDKTFKIHANNEEEAIDSLDRMRQEPGFFPDLPDFGDEWDATYSEWPEDQMDVEGSAEPV